MRFRKTLYAFALLLLHSNAINSLTIPSSQSNNVATYNETLLETPPTGIVDYTIGHDSGMYLRYHFTSPPIHLRTTELSVCIADAVQVLQAAMEARGDDALATNEESHCRRGTVAAGFLNNAHYPAMKLWQLAYAFAGMQFAGLYAGYDWRAGIEVYRGDPRRGGQRLAFGGQSALAGDLVVGDS